MLISHRYKFIFLKTEKTASSSLNAIFRQIIRDQDEAFRAEGSVRRRLLREHGSLENFSFFGVGGSERQRLPSLFGLHRHARARDVRRFLGPELFDRYTIVTSERNPWDRQVSLFTHRASKHPDRVRKDFTRSLTSPFFNFLHHNRLDNWGIYTIGGKVCAHHVIRFENLETDYRAVLEALGLDGARYPLPHRRARARSKGPDYREYYTDEAREIVGRWYRRETEYFGYTF
jgi:hypothetical protein